MSGSLEAERKTGESAPPLSLAEAASLLGCHVETLRIRIRSGRLQATRGAHGGYYVAAEDLALLHPLRRMKRRPVAADALAGVPAYVERMLDAPGRWTTWQRRLLANVRTDSAADPPLYHLLAVRFLLEQRHNTLETAALLGLSIRQVYRLRRASLSVALVRARARSERAERGRLRRDARDLVAEIQRQLERAGFRTARRDPRSRLARAREGRTARIALVWRLSADQARDLLRAGLTERQVDAISLVGIGADELNELLLHGLPPGHPTGGPGASEPIA